MTSNATLNPTTLSALEMADLVARGDISAVELVTAHIEHIEQVNPALNAVVVKRYEEALGEARQADDARRGGETLGPLHGVPVTIKECLDVTGTASTFGLTTRANHRAERDDRFVAGLRSAGAIVLGKTNVAQCLMFYETDNPLFGKTVNPWNHDRTCGGSSGGEGAIIAAGGSPLGLGTDIGGSCRIPAAFCGVVGFKATHDRLPDPGRHSIPIGQRAVVSQVGVLARHVADAALALETINRVNREPVLPWVDFRTVDVTRLRVAMHVHDGTLAVAPAIRRAVHEAAECLRAHGVTVEEWTPPAVPEAVHLYFALLGGDGLRGLRQTLRGERIDSRINKLIQLAGFPQPVRNVAGILLGMFGQPTLSAFLKHFGFGTVTDHWAKVEAQMTYRERFAASLERDQFDAVLCPACPLPAFPHGESEDLGLAGGYGLLWNLLGYPAGVVPVSRVRVGEEVGRTPSRDLVEKAAFRVESGSRGLPAGVQVAARPWREEVALALMNIIQESAKKQADYPHCPDQ